MPAQLSHADHAFIVQRFGAAAMVPGQPLGTISGNFDAVWEVANTPKWTTDESCQMEATQTAMAAGLIKLCWGQQTNRVSTLFWREKWRVTVG